MWKWDNQEPFGNDAPNRDPENTAGQFNFNLRFPGQYADIETNTSYNLYRDYDSTTGRYLQADPIGLLGGGNVFAYTFDPLTQIDPRGLMGNPSQWGKARQPNQQTPLAVVALQTLSVLIPVVPFVGITPNTACGSSFRVPNIFDTTFIESACVSHDKCYSSCGTNKDDCDRKFRADIQHQCGSGVRCVVGSQLYFAAVQRLGGGAFQRSQANCKPGDCPLKSQ